MINYSITTYKLNIIHTLIIINILCICNKKIHVYQCQIWIHCLTCQYQGFMKLWMIDDLLQKKLKITFKKNEIVYWCCAVVTFSFLSIAYIKLYWNLKFNWNKLNKYFYYAYFDDCVLTFECMRMWTVHSKAWNCI